MDERRASVRWPYRQRAHYCPANDLIPRDGCLTTLSERGLGLLSHEHHQAGERITVSFLLPDHADPLTMTGTVRWAEARPQRGRWYSVGLEWAPCEAATRYRLDTFLQQHLTAQSSPHAAAGAPRWPTQALPAPLSRRITVGVSIVLGILLSVRVLMLQGERGRLHHAIHQRNLVISQLEVREERFEQELNQATDALSKTTGEVERLDVQTQQFQEGMQRLTTNVERFQTAYTRAREEREQLMHQIVDLEQERDQMVQRLASIPMLRQVIDETIEARHHRGTDAAPPPPLEPALRESK